MFNHEYDYRPNVLFNSQSGNYRSDRSDGSTCRTDIKLQTGFVMLGLTELERPGCCCSHWKMKDRVLLREILEGNLADLLYA